MAFTPSAHGIVIADPFIRTTATFGWTPLTASISRLCPLGIPSELRSNPRIRSCQAIREDHRNFRIDRHLSRLLKQDSVTSPSLS
jgi:hypothetical protein